MPSSALFFWLTNVGVANGSVNVKEAYAELAVPILKDTPFFQELSINGAGRITDYSTSGTVKTWKLSAKWAPVSDLTFRGTLSRDIRAPNLIELFAGPQSGIGSQLRRRPAMHDLALVDGIDAVAHGKGALRVLLDQQHGYALAAQPADELHHQLPNARRQTLGRFIKQQEAG